MRPRKSLYASTCFYSIFALFYLMIFFTKESVEQGTLSFGSNDPSNKFNLPLEIKKLLHFRNLPQSNSKNKIVIAVIDTGTDLNHPIFYKKLWQNPGESGINEMGEDRSKNGIDDDGNGLIDDVNGWNFADRNHDLVDMHGHGTHIAGIIASTAPSTKIMTLKYYNPLLTNGVNVQNTVNAIRYAIAMKVDIINYSSGGLEPNTFEKEAIADAQKAGILFVAAAGNEGSNADSSPFFPASYNLDNILSVTAINSKSKVLVTSNFGLNSVDLAAPGFEIRSALPKNEMGEMTGTSQATAFVSALASRLIGKNPKYKDNSMIIDRIKKTLVWKEHLAKKAKFAGQLSFLRALTMKDNETNSALESISELPDISTLIQATNGI